MDEKFYRIMKEPTGKWGGYHMESDHDFYSDYKSVPCGKLEAGEYLTIDSDGTWSVISDRDDRNLTGVRYPGMPPVSELLTNGTMIEVPREVMLLDLQMAEKKRELADSILRCESYISDVEYDLQNPTNPFCAFSPVEAKKQLAELKPELETLTQQMDALKAMYHEQVEPYFNTPQEAAAMMRDAEPEENGFILQTGEGRKPSIPVGRIDYLRSNGMVGESIDYYDAEKFVSDIKRENYYGAPMAITVYSDPASGTHMDTSWRLDLDPPPQGFRIEPYREPAQESAQKKAAPTLDVKLSPNASQESPDRPGLDTLVANIQKQSRTTPQPSVPTKMPVLER